MNNSITFFDEQALINTQSMHFNANLTASPCKLNNKCPVKCMSKKSEDNLPGIVRGRGKFMT